MAFPPVVHLPIKFRSPHGTPFSGTNLRVPRCECRARSADKTQNFGKSHLYRGQSADLNAVARRIFVHQMEICLKPIIDRLRTTIANVGSMTSKSEKTQIARRESSRYVPRSISTVRSFVRVRLIQYALNHPPMPGRIASPHNAVHTFTVAPHEVSVPLAPPIHLLAHTNRHGRILINIHHSPSGPI